MISHKHFGDDQLNYDVNVSANTVNPSGIPSIDFANFENSVAELLGFSSTPSTYQGQGQSWLSKFWNDLKHNVKPGAGGAGGGFPKLVAQLFAKKPQGTTDMAGIGIGTILLIGGGLFVAYEAFK